MIATRPVVRTALQAVRTTTRRSYATTDRPPLAQGGSNRNVIIGLTTVSVTALAYFYTREKNPGKDNTIANSSSAIVNNPEPLKFADRQPKPPKSREERQGDVQHPEDLDDSYRAPFGVQHARKRVDEPPSNRNHETLTQRAKENAKDD
ncbi:uncharacterized protein B0I36DRAFT_360327 [Microdochium trichocladiopsis]|uniref:Uncharacterized protein n=1 Tax=Microdochium trichocladiopsis TaxID=1682393 RepID=A0A9P9BSJ1_9PEZI|nr:uncharacterized protein B0I36DRAFT_360327 [Microdochium trichocladiopsis]KAH7034860.1 hypothetical protein B0I36DRAFT_360327 [Microdochium trichocladiopsis]